MSKVRKQKRVPSANVQTDVSIERDESYEKARRAALALLQRGCHLGGVHSIPRDALHERLAPTSIAQNPSKPK